MHGELAIYFVRADAAEPTTDEHARVLALATKHAVAAYYVPVTFSPQPRCSVMLPLG